MDITQNSLFSLFNQEDLILCRNETLLYEGVAEDWALDGWSTADFDLLICLDGEAFYEDDLGKWHILPGTAYLARPGFKIKARMGPEKKYHVLAQHFTLRIPGGADILEWIEFPSAGLLTHFRLALEYADLCRVSSPFPFMADSLFRTVLWDFLEGNAAGGLRLSGTGGTKSTPLEKVLDLARLIRESDPDDRELDRLQSGRGYSPVYIRDLFKSHFGKTPRQYRTDLRLKKAGMLLKEGLSVKQTAGACGFPDELYFSRLFRKKVGISPSQFASEAEI